MSEFTSDRAGLLVCQDPKVCIRAMIKIFENIDDKSIEKVEVPTGDPIFYEFSDGNIMKKQLHVLVYLYSGSRIRVHEYKYDFKNKKNLLWMVDQLIWWS